MPDRKRIEEPSISKEKTRTLMIASYREPYSEESLEKIKKIIGMESPDRIIILKVIEEESTSELVDATVGLEEKEDFLESVREGKKQQADEYASEIIELTDTLDIPTEVHLRKGEVTSDEIIQEFDRMQVDHVVIHQPEKGPLGKILEGSTSEDVRENIEHTKITMV